MNDLKTPEEKPDESASLTPEEKALLGRLETRFTRHRNDKLMIWLKRISGRYLFDKLRSGVSL